MADKHFKAGTKTELRTEAIVLKRTNYGETDRILAILTPEGKRSVLAKGVRKERSKLAGGIEMFCVSEVVLHLGRGELAILTSAKMKAFYKNILANFEVLEAASEILKKITKVAEGTDNADYYKITKECLAALDKGAPRETVLTWFYFNVVRVGGEQMNLFYDANGDKLIEDGRYNWDAYEKVLRPVGQSVGKSAVEKNRVRKSVAGKNMVEKSAAGKVGAEEIKMMRLMLSADLELVLRVKNTEQMMPELSYIAKTLNQL